TLKHTGYLSSKIDKDSLVLHLYCRFQYEGLALFFLFQEGNHKLYKSQVQKRSSHNHPYCFQEPSLTSQVHLLNLLIFQLVCAFSSVHSPSTARPLSSTQLADSPPPR